jgi:hypothetical protein
MLAYDIPNTTIGNVTYAMQRKNQFRRPHRQCRQPARRWEIQV